MFWSAKYVAVRELNFLLKEENVSLSQVLEADDILQECKADNKALIQFLTKPDVLAELITLIIEEPPKHVELASQYRHASIACEVLTSHLALLSDRLSLDTSQMHRLCDFISKDPPLNPLLASYFSKTIEMLLERSPKQDWYLYHIVSLRVLDFFKSRRDFLPNLMRHLATSAIADTFKYFIRLDDLFNKLIMEWLEEHQFLESLIQIICGTYAPEQLPPRPAPPSAPPAPAPSAPASAPSAPTTAPSIPTPVPSTPTPAPSAPPPTSVPPLPENKDTLEKGEREQSEKVDVNHKADGIEDGQVTNMASTDTPQNDTEHQNHQPIKEEPLKHNAVEVESVVDADARAARIQAIASANAAGLLCDLIMNGCAGEGCTTRPRTSWVLLSRLQSEEMVRLLLQSIFTSPLPARRHAVVNGCQVLLALLSQDPILASECETGRTSVELAVAPHLPLLHHALLHDPEQYLHAPRDAVEGAPGPGGERVCGGARGERVGAARVHVAALLAQLALSEVEEVPTTLLTLGTPGTLLDMFFQYPHNSFLHAQVYALVKHALANRVYRAHYAAHLIVECDLLTRFMDVFEENEAKKDTVTEDGSSQGPRSAYMGHVLLSLARLARALDPAAGDLALELALPDELMARWYAFLEDRLRPLLHRHETPLGGYYPSENIYEVEDMSDTMAAYEFNDMGTAGLDDIGEEINADEMCGAGGAGGVSELADGFDDDVEKMASAKNSFLELASQRFDDVWDDTPEPDGVDEVLGEGEEDEAGGAAVRVQEVLGDSSPWETPLEESSSAGEGWAQFGSDMFGAPADPFAPSDSPAAPPADPAGTLSTFTEDFDQNQEFTPFWSCSTQDNSGEASTQELEHNMLELRLERDASQLQDSSAELANNLLTAMSAMAPDVIANIVNANMPADLPLTPDKDHTDDRDNQS